TPMTTVGGAVRVGAVDIGTNSIRLLVADVPPEGATLITLNRAGESCRLGRGMDRTGAIDMTIARRASSIVADFVRRAQPLGAGSIVIGATAALRNASNGEEVRSLIAARSGLPVRILTGDEEAKLVFESVVRGLGPMASRSPCVVFDIGGGSTEVVSGVG